MKGFISRWLPFYMIVICCIVIPIYVHNANNSPAATAVIIDHYAYLPLESAAEHWLIAELEGRQVAIRVNARDWFAIQDGDTVSVRLESGVYVLAKRR